MKTQVYLVKAFSNDNDFGNPAGVVHDSSNLSDEQMLSIAQILGFSESAFVQTSDKADFRVRFFASKEEVDFCGHATVATFYSLIEQGTIKLDDKESVEVSQETNIGVLPVICHKDGKIMMAQNNPEFGFIEDDRAMIATLLGLEVSELSDYPIQVVSTGAKKMIIPVESLAFLRKIKPNFEGISSYCNEKDIKGLSVFTSEAVNSGSDLSTRAFNPLVGIDEDSATGIAAGPLACYADKYIFEDGKKELVIDQGFDMGMKSIIYVDITNGVLVGGYGASFGEQIINV